MLMTKIAFLGNFLFFLYFFLLPRRSNPSIHDAGDVMRMHALPFHSSAPLLFFPSFVSASFIDALIEPAVLPRHTPSGTLLRTPTGASHCLRTLFDKRSALFIMEWRCLSSTSPTQFPPAPSTAVLAFPPAAAPARPYAAPTALNSRLRLSLSPCSGHRLSRREHTPSFFQTLTLRRPSTGDWDWGHTRQTSHWSCRRLPVHLHEQPTSGGGDGGLSAASALPGEYGLAGHGAERAAAAAYQAHYHMEGAEAGTRRNWPTRGIRFQDGTTRRRTRTRRHPHPHHP
ncbi:hypothetical protein B0H12DRAFT_313941 [Mycena haematopus]|nr:hypothetical protein B0H12DRAFT_313941 [Mycena haematopus]